MKRKLEHNWYWLILLLELLPGGEIITGLFFCRWVFRPYTAADDAERPSDIG